MPHLRTIFVEFAVLPYTWFEVAATVWLFKKKNLKKISLSKISPLHNYYNYLGQGMSLVKSIIGWSSFDLE